MSRKVKNRIQLAGLHVFYCCICFLALVPIVYALSLSFSSASGALSSDFVLINGKFTLENYRAVIMEKPFFRWFYNSALLSIFTMIVAIGFAVTASYAFSRYRFKGRMGLLKLLLLLNAFPQILSMFALFRLVKELNIT